MPDNHQHSDEDPPQYEGDAILLPRRVNQLERDAKDAKERDEQYKRKQITLDSRLVTFTGLLVLTSFISGGISIWQATIARRSANAAKSAAETAKNSLTEIQKTGTDTHALAVAAGKQADAAKIANTTTREALTSVQRSFVYFIGSISATKTISNNKVTELVLTLPWANTGTTPTKNAKTQINWETMVGDLPEAFTFPDLGKIAPLQFEIPPRGFSSSTLNIPIRFVDPVRKKSTRLFVWGWITYNDIFENTPTRLSEFCDEVMDVKSSTEDITDPSANITWQLSICRTHNCSDERCADYKERTQIKH